MIFRQFLHASPIGASYLFGCGGQNRAFGIEDVDAFVQAMLTDIPAPPPNAEAIRSANLNAIRGAASVHG